MISRLERLKKLRAKSARRPTKPEAKVDLTRPLVEIIPSLASTREAYTSPRHLEPLPALLDEAFDKPVFVLVSVPPRHGKTETILAGIAKGLARKPTARVAYATYGFQVARLKSRRCKEFFGRLGGTYSEDVGQASHWETSAGGGLLATGTGGPLTSLGFDVLVVDDPTKNRADAESKVIRDRTFSWLTSTAMTRVEPGGSVIVCHTRWHEDDTIGRLRKIRDAAGDADWIEINLPAITEDGAARWPERWPLALLEKRRRTIGEYDWASLFMGAPRPRGTALFRGTYFYEKRPEGRLRIAIGLDLAYSERTQSDYSIAVVLAKCDDVYYVLDVFRDQVPAPKFLAQLQTIRRKYAGAPMRWYAYGTEKGSADFFIAAGLPLDVHSTSGDKFIRAQGVSAQWNEGNVRLPRRRAELPDVDSLEEADAIDDEGVSPAWVEPFANEVCDFSGVSDDHDDQVDALAAAFDALSDAGPVHTPKRTGGYRLPAERGFG